MSRMVVYTHYDEKVGEVKFGDHFVSLENCTLEEAKSHTNRYIREKQYPRKYWYFDSGAVKVRVWDVTEYAKKIGKFYGGSKIDDVIRPAIGGIGKTGKEYHTGSFEEVNFKIDRFLSDQGQDLPELALTTLQYKAAVEAVELFDAGKRCILADLAARFGKTVWSPAVTMEIEADPKIIIVASYVKTVFASFAGDLVGFQQFAEHNHIDAQDGDYKEQVNAALKAGKKAFVYLSLYKGQLRQDRIDFLFGLNCNKMLIVDEADYGAHKSGQAKPLIDKLDESVYTIIMTGTNADRAATFWPVDAVLSVTYVEMLIQKEKTKNAQELQT
jgi:hypothetical protein